MDGWQYTVDLNDLNDPKTQYFYLAIGAGLGVKVGKAPACQTGSQGVGHDQRCQHHTGTGESHWRRLPVLCMAKCCLTTKPWPLLTGVADGGENAHSFTSLVEIARVRMAREQGKTSFDTEIMYEVDGVANGPMLGQLPVRCLPRFNGSIPGSSAKRRLLFRRYEEHFWYLDQPGSFDLYQTVASTMTEEIGQFTDQETNRAYSGLWAIVGEMLENGKVTSAARNLVKNPVTILNLVRA